MPKSTILKFLSQKLKDSYFLGLFSSSIDIKESPIYTSFLTSLLLQPINYINRLIDFSAERTILTKTIKSVKLKSVILYLFILVQVIFPGYGTEDTGLTLLYGSPANSSNTHIGFIINLIFFVLSFAGVFFLFIRDVNKNTLVLNFSRFEIVLLLFLLSISFSSVFSIYPNISLVWLIKVYRAVMVYFVFSRLIIKKRHLTAICYSFVSIIFLESILAIAQYIHQGFIGIPFETAANTSNSQVLYTFLNGTMFFRPPGTIVGANGLSFVLAFLIPVSMILFFDKRFIVKTISLISLIFACIVSIITFSRWGILTFIFSLIVFLFLTHRMKKKFNFSLLLVSSFFLMVIILGLFTIQPDFLTRFFFISMDDGSLSTRLQLIIQAVYVISHNFLLGIGGDTFPKYLINYDFTPDKISQFFPSPVHSFPILMISESGIISFVLFCSLIFYIILSFFKKIKNIKLFKYDFNSLFLIAIFTSITAYLFNGLWQIQGLGNHLGAVLFFMGIGLYFNVLRSI